MSKISFTALAIPAHGLVNSKIMLKFILTLLCFACGNAFAVTECASTVNHGWAGDGGAMWVFLENGMSAYTLKDDPNTKSILSLATVALMTGKTVVMRFSADNLPCNNTSVNRSDVLGMYLYK